MDSPWDGSPGVPGAPNTLCSNPLSFCPGTQSGRRVNRETCLQPGPRDPGQAPVSARAGRAAVHWARRTPGTRGADAQPPPGSNTARYLSPEDAVHANSRNGPRASFPRCAPFPSDPFPASDQRLRLSGQRLRGSRLLRDPLPLPQPLRGRGLPGARAPAHGGHALQIQRLPGKCPPSVSLGSSCSLDLKAVPARGQPTNVNSRANGRGRTGG